MLSVFLQWPFLKRISCTGGACCPFLPENFEVCLQLLNCEGRLFFSKMFHFQLFPFPKTVSHLRRFKFMFGLRYGGNAVRFPLSWFWIKYGLPNLIQNQEAPSPELWWMWGTFAGTLVNPVSCERVYIWVCVYIHIHLAVYIYVCIYVCMVVFEKSFHFQKIWQFPGFTRSMCAPSCEL